MVGKLSFRKTSSAEYLAKLDSACQWLSVERGRAARYGQIIREFQEKEGRSREHILAYAESHQIIDIYQLWEQQITDFPGLENKIRAVFSKGPLLREDEKPEASSGRARDDAFGYLLAGMLLKAGIPVVAVEGIVARDAKCDSEADITFRSSGGFIDVECKRPRSGKALVKRVKEARKQIARPNRDGRQGVIALDCSVLVRPAETLLESVSPNAAESYISRVLETNVTPRVTPCLTNSILGFLLFAGVPAMTRSPIVTQKEKPIFRPDYISTWLAVSNSKSTDPDVVRWVANRLDRMLHLL